MESGKGAGSGSSPEKSAASKQLLKEKLQQQVMLHVRKAEAQFEAKLSVVQKQLEETREQLSSTKKQYEEEHQQLTDALSLLDEYEQGLEASNAAELKAIDMEAERNAAVEAKEQLELKNSILQRKVQNIEKQYNALQEEKRAELEKKELTAIDLQEEIVQLREQLLETQESSLLSAVKKPTESSASAELAQLRAEKAALQQELQAAKKEAAKADAYKKEAEELSSFVAMLEEDVRAMKEIPSPRKTAGERSSVATHSNEEEQLAELRALLEIGQEELEMTKEQLESVTNLYNDEKKNVTLLARKYKELDKSYRSIAGDVTPRGGEAAPFKANDDIALVKELKAKVDELTSRLREQDVALQSLVSEKATMEAHYQNSARRMTVELDKYKPVPSSTPEGVQQVAGLPSFAQVSKQLQQLEPSLHSCSWREKAQILLALMTKDPAEQARIMGKIRL